MALHDNFFEYWSKRQQVIRHKVAVYEAVTNFEEQDGLKVGDTAHRPYRSALSVNTVGTGGSYVRQSISVTDEYLIVNVKKETTFYLEDADAIQSSYRDANFFADDAIKKLTNWIDGDVLGEYDQADSKIGNYEMGGGGSAGDGIGFTLTTSNILNLFGKARKKLDALNIDQNNRWAVISPEFFDILWQFLAGKESNLGDTTGKNGNVGSYGGFTLYKSNACGWSARLEFGTNPTANDTVTINGVTWTFKAAPAAAGEVDIGADAAASLDLLVAAVNNSNGYAAEAGSATTYYEVTATNRLLLQGITATNATTAMTVKGEGVGYCAVSEGLTAAADIWTTTMQIQHVLFGQGKPTDLIVQKTPKLEIFHRDGYIGKDHVNWIMYGLKTFDEGDALLCDCQIRSDAF